MGDIRDEIRSVLPYKHVCIRGVEADDVIATLAKQFDGYSASDIKDVCQGAQLLVVNELFKSSTYHEPVEGETPQDPRELTMADFKDIKSKRKPSVSIENIRAYHKWSESFGAL